MIRRHVGACMMLVGGTTLMATHANAQQRVAVESVASDIDPAVAQALWAKPVTITFQRFSVRQALDSIAAHARISVSYYSDDIAGLRTVVTGQFTRVPLSTVLNQVLEGTSLVPRAIGANRLSIVDGGRQRAVVADGAISGTVIDAKTRQPLRGATILLDGMNRGVRADENGRFRFPTVSASEHAVVVRLLGYARLRKTVVVNEGQTATVELALEASQNTLDQVVVTGTVVATELKAVPNAITVITAKQIEERGITRVDQLFRGDVPGLFARNRGSDAPLDAVVMYSRGASSIGSNSARGSVNNTNPIKTYVDGVELSDPQYLSQIDPQSIERIEILTGPQASTIYGSNALNGVMQIFTKRGTSKRPQLTLELINGWVQSNFSRALTPLQDYTAQLNGVDGNISYNGGASWNYTAPWTPARQTRRMGAFGGVRFALPTPAGMATADFTYRQNNTHNEQHGRDDKLLGYLRETGWYSGPSNGFMTERIADWTGETFGVTMGYMPTSWWSHELTLGRDNSSYQTQWRDAYLTPSDSSPSLIMSSVKRSSLRYTTTIQIPMRDVARMTFTAGGDSWQDVDASSVGPTALSLGGARIPSHNAGGFFQAQLGVWDRLFFTYGMRAEWNPWFGKDAMPSYAPRYGATYTSMFGPITAKIRASYGRSTRPPLFYQKWATPISPTDVEQIAVYGSFDEQIANPVLGPEHQQGGEGGVELYFGNRASIVVTRYNQTVDGLIARILGADSVKSIVANPTFSGITCATQIQRGARNYCSSQDADGYGYRWVYQNVNAASIRNQGWELQGSTVFGPLTARGTYSWTKSRVMGLTQEYRRLIEGDRFASNTYRPGGTFSLIPEHTGALGLTYARARTSASLNMMWTGALRSEVSESKIRYVDGSVRLKNNLWIDRRARDLYLVTNPGYTQMDFNATHRLMSRVEALVQILNLTDLYPNDFSAVFATMGRQTKVGVRIR